MNRLLQVLFCSALVFPAFCVAAERVMIATPGQGLFEMPIVAAMRNGYFTTEGLEVYKIQIRPEIAVKALLAGEVDYILAWDASVRAAMMGVPIKGVVIIASKPLHIFISRPEIRHAKDLRGKTVGVDFSGSTVDYLSRVSARYLGFDPARDVSIVDVGHSSLRFAALKDGSIDATVLEVALAVKAEEDGFKRLLHLGEIIDFPVSAIAVTHTKLAKQRDQIKKFIRSTLRGTRFIKQKRPESVRMIQSYLRITPTQASKAYDASVRSFTNDGFVFDRAISLSIQRAREELQMAKDPPFSQVVDWSVLGEIKLERSRIPSWIRSDDP